MFKIDLEFITLGSMAACLVTGAFLDHRKASNQDLSKKECRRLVPEPLQTHPISSPIASGDLVDLGAHIKSEPLDLPCSVTAAGKVSRRGGCERVADVAAEVA